MSYRAAVITCSDRAASGVYRDRTGQELRDALVALGFDVSDPVVVPDEVAQISLAIGRAIDAGARILLTTGGTGIGPRDVTVEATAPLLSYQVPGVAEAVRAAGLAVTPTSTLSRGMAGVIESGPRRAFVFNAPGSRGGARDALAVLGPILTHIVEQLDGADHDQTPG